MRIGANLHSCDGAVDRLMAGVADFHRRAGLLNARDVRCVEFNHARAYLVQDG
jgi:hypothetical protein